MNIQIGIDPGKNGGIAIQGEEGVSVSKMPETEGDILDLLRSSRYLIPGKPAVAHIEDIPKFVGKNVPSSSAIVLGRNYGFLLGVLQTLDYRINLIRPQAWQKTLGLGNSRGMTNTAWKNKLKAKAQQLYPGLHITLATADALLILEAGQRTENNL